MKADVPMHLNSTSRQFIYICHCHNFQINTADFSSSQWVTCFQDTGTEILGKSAQELGELRDQDSPEYNDAFQRANFREFIFRIRAKMDNYNVS